MAEENLYQPVKDRLSGLLATKGRQFYLEVTSTKGLSEKLKGKIPPHREIVFAFLKKRPDLFGFVEGQFGTSDLITVEVKERLEKLDDIYKRSYTRKCLMPDTVSSSPQSPSQRRSNDSAGLRSIFSTPHRIAPIVSWPLDNSIKTTGNSWIGLRKTPFSGSFIGLEEYLLNSRSGARDFRRVKRRFLLRRLPTPPVRRPAS